MPVDKDAAAAEASAAAQTSEQQGEVSISDITELNTKNALTLLGTEKLFWTVLKDYFEAIEKKAKVILDHKAAERWRDYTIEVHSLKSTSRQIGADEIADVAMELEKAGNEGNIDLINEKTDGMIDNYLKLHEALKKYFGDAAEEEERFAEFEDIVSMLERMHEALDNFDTLQVDEVIEEMSKFQYSDENEEFFDNLKNAAADSDMDACLNIVNEWGKELINPNSGVKKTLELLNSLQEAIDNFDILEMDEVVNKMSRRSFGEIDKAFFEKMHESVESSDIAQCSEIVAKWKADIEARQ